MNNFFLKINSFAFAVIAFGILNMSANSVSATEACLLVDGKLCAEFTGAQWTSDQRHKSCAEHQGVITQDTCSADNVVAECILNKGLGNEALVKYYLPVSRDNAALDCNQANGILR